MHYFKKSYIFLITLLVPFLLKGQDTLPSRWTLDQCVRYALENNFEARQYGLMVERAGLLVQSSKNLFLPFVDARLRNNYNWGLFIDPSTNILTTRNTQVYAGAVEGEWILFNGGYNYYSVKQSKELYQASVWDQRSKNNEITLNVFMAYYQLLYANEQLRIAHAQRTQTEKQMALIRGMVDRGILHRRELLQMESQLGMNDVLIVDAQNLIQKSNLLLRQMLGISIPVNLAIDSVATGDIPDTLIVASYDSISSGAARFLPEISRAKSQLEARKYGMKIAQASRYPSFSITGGVITKSSSLIQEEQSRQFRQNLSEYLTFNLRVPLFNRFQTVNNISLSRIDVMIQENEVRKVNLETEQRVQTAYLDLIAAHKKYQAVDKQMQALESQYQLAERSYSGGIINFTEYSYTMNLYRNSLLQLLQAKYDFLYKQQVLDFYQGKKP